MGRLLGWVLLLMASLLIWFNPLTHDLCVLLDENIFRVLNNSLLGNEILQLIFTVLNHKLETKLNIVVMALINIICIFNYPKEKRGKVFFSILFFWGFFQIGLGLHDYYFEKYLGVSRLSPSLVLDNPVLLSEIFNNKLIKDSSLCCFPSGHALALTYWLCFSVLYMPKSMKFIISLIILFLLFPRVVSGAHWISDVVFSALLGLCWYQAAILIKNFVPKGVGHLWEHAKPAG